MCCLLLGILSCVLLSLSPAQGAELRILDAVAAPGMTVDVPVLTTEVTGLLAADIEITFPGTILAFSSARLGALASGFLLETAATDQSVALALAGGQAVSGLGTLVVLSFEVRPDASPGVTAPIAFVSAALNEGAIPVSTTNGDLDVLGTPVGEGAALLLVAAALGCGIRRPTRRKEVSR
ncbi:MAG: hypothetical protein HYV63_28290 [Candidatus Schekmanbacteria bacterium]|nr:hypothetical protein [Candidatus Schekmanbacteria bacterium]